jgi:acyl-CoA thioester hydrolase
MFISETEVRVRYAETDQMGYCYYGNYAQFFEVGRVEALRSLGHSYKSLEEQGLLLPVSEYSIKYIKPAFYDDLLTIRTLITELPHVRFKFDYETLSPEGEIINRGSTTLVFVSKETGRPVKCPSSLSDALAKEIN